MKINWFVYFNRSQSNSQSSPVASLTRLFGAQLGYNSGFLGPLHSMIIIFQFREESKEILPTALLHKLPPIDAF